MKLTARTPFGNRVPGEAHTVLQADRLRPGRIIVIGDVHGCLDQLNDLLLNCKYSDNDNIIFAGDIVNKGPYSLEVLSKAKELNAFVVRGNHEDACLALRKRLSVVTSLLKPYKWTTALTDTDVQYLYQLPFSITLEEYHTIIVHAGFVPDGTPLEEQSYKTMLFLEDVEPEETNARGEAVKFKSHYKSNTAKTKCASWAKYWKGKQHVIFGHASDRKLQLHTYATGLDTGCVAGDCLTACILPPMSELQNMPAFQEYKTKHSAVRAPTLAELGASLVNAKNTSKQPPQTGHDFGDVPPDPKPTGFCGLRSMGSMPLERTGSDHSQGAGLASTPSAPLDFSKHATGVHELP